MQEMQETQIQILGQEDPLQEEMAAGSNPWGCKRDTKEHACMQT